MDGQGRTPTSLARDGAGQAVIIVAGLILVMLIVWGLRVAIRRARKRARARAEARARGATCAVKDAPG